MDEHLTKVIVSIICTALDAKVNNQFITADDIACVEVLANKQQITPIFTYGLKKLNYSDLLTETLKNSEAKAIFDYTQQKVSLDEISEALEMADISYIPLKGSAIRDLYPEPWMRTCADIDVLIKKDDIDNAIRVLESYTSFKFTKRGFHEVHFVNKYVHLELHYSIETVVAQNGFSFSESWNYVLTSEASCACSFTPEYNLFYIITHAAKHFLKNGGIGIRPILDIYIIKTHTHFDDNKVKALCKCAGDLGFYEMICKLIDVWFNGDSHDEYSSIFEDIVLDGGVFGSQHSRIVSNKRNDAGKRYIRRRIFKTSRELQRYYPMCKKYHILVPFYQVIRWIHLLKYKRPKAYLAEFKMADAVDQSEVDNYDKLLNAMGF